MTSSVATPITQSQPRHAEPLAAAYWGLVFFLVVYCSRPEDWIPGLGGIPLAKITGGFALAAFVFSAGLQRSGALKLPRTMKFMILLLAQLFLAALLSPVWRGGAMDVVVNEFSKVVLIAIVITLTAISPARLRTLLFVQASTVALIGMVSVYKSRSIAGRLEGVLGGTYSNPNDLALSLAIAIPLCFAFLLLSRSPLRKVAWASAIILMSYAVTLTYSRGGLLALLAAFALSVWEFGVKGKRKSVLFMAALAALGILFFAMPRGYGSRVQTIFNPDADTTGSAQERIELFKRSLEVTAEHPLFGVGPGNFQVLSGNWHVTHDSFTQMSSEGGIAALVLFILILKWAFADIRKTKQMSAAAPEAQTMAEALRASLWAFIVGSLFASVAYLFFPYLLIGYVGALDHIVCSSDAGGLEAASALSGGSVIADAYE